MSNVILKKNRSNLLEFSATVDGETLDLTGQAVFFALKHKFSDDDVDAIVVKRNGQGIVIDAGTSGTGTVQLDPGDLADLPDYPSGAVYELVVRDNQGREYSVDSGDASIVPSVLKNTPV